MSAAPHPFRIANYRFYWFTRLFSMLAVYAMMLIVAWQAYNLARETMGIAGASARLGLIGLLQFIPLFCLTPVTGWVADHMDRRWVVRIVLTALAAIAGTLALLTYSQSMTLTLLYFMAVLLGTARAFLGPAQGALAPNLVPKEVLPQAIALSTIAWQFGALVGPGIAGPLYGIAPHLPYTLSAILYAASAICMFFVGDVPRSAPKRTGPIEQIVEGARYVWRNKLVFGAITLDLFAVLLAGATALIPVFARDIIDLDWSADMIGGPIGDWVRGSPEHALSLLAASPAVGAAVVAAIFSIVPLKSNVGVKMLVAVFVFGGATIAFGFSTLLWFSMLCLFVVGASDMFSVYIRQSLIQLNTPDDKRGRVGAVSQLTISASNELGEAESGFLAALIGPVWAVVAGGIGATAITAVWIRLFPQLAGAKTFDPSDEVLASEPDAMERGAGPKVEQETKSKAEGTP
ncbi:MFS transporter [Novosphingopyxis iocasae]|uniref:MFS transporter n=1 Tax=Novosphingopyxis iocasae TaxID=2762729 RepID=UPI00165125DC|nr:MFS transporter [Novosphingopyxis iocasae]